MKLSIDGSALLKRFGPICIQTDTEACYCETAHHRFSGISFDFIPNIPTPNQLPSSALPAGDLISYLWAPALVVVPVDVTFTLGNSLSGIYILCLEVMNDAFN